MLLKKKNQYKIIITKYLNIAIIQLFHQTRACARGCSNNDGCITSHNKRGEQAFYTKYTGK